MNRIKLIALLLCMSGIMLEAKSKYTFAMIKPHAVQEEKTDEILNTIRKAGFVIVAMRKMILTDLDARNLYKEYKWKNWFDQYIKTLADLPVVVMVLKKENAVSEWDRYKKIIRLAYHAISHHNNIIHGSDSERAARREIALFFKDL